MSTHTCTRSSKTLRKDLVATSATPSPQLPGQAVQDQTCLETSRFSSLRARAQSTGKPQLPLSSDLGTNPQGKRKRGCGGPGWQQEPYYLPRGLPSPQDPRAAKMWLGPSLSLPLLAAPPKGAATNSLCHSEAPESGPESPGRAWGREYQKPGRVSLMEDRTPLTHS